MKLVKMFFSYPKVSEFSYLTPSFGKGEKVIWHRIRIDNEPHKQFIIV